MEKDFLYLSPAERRQAAVLVVDGDALDRNNLRSALKSLGYGGIADAPSHLAAMEKLGERNFSHVIFDAREIDCPVREWLTKVLVVEPLAVAIPTSSDPSIDDVFDLLVAGARGYLCKPFTIDTVDQAILAATKGEPFSEAILTARDRNEALVAILMSNLDRAAAMFRQAEKFETAARDLTPAIMALRRSADLARTFAKGGDPAFLEELERFCIERSRGPASRLGRLRKRLASSRVSDEPPTE